MAIISIPVRCGGLVHSVSFTEDWDVWMDHHPQHENEQALVEMGMTEPECFRVRDYLRGTFEHGWVFKQKNSKKHFHGFVKDVVFRQMPTDEVDDGFSDIDKYNMISDATDIGEIAGIKIGMGVLGKIAWYCENCFMDYKDVASAIESLQEYMIGLQGEWESRVESSIKMDRIADRARDKKYNVCFPEIDRLMYSLLYDITRWGWPSGVFRVRSGVFRVRFAIHEDFMDHCVRMLRMCLRVKEGEAVEMLDEAVIEKFAEHTASVVSF